MVLCPKTNGKRKFFAAFALLTAPVDGHAKLRTKQQAQEPSQPRGQPPALRTKQLAQETSQPRGQPPALRTKQRAQEPSQSRGQPPAKSPTRVSRVTWVPS